MKTKIINIKAITVSILITFIISIANVGSYANAADSLMDINRTVPVSTVKAGDTFDVKYTITPKPITASSQDSNKQKDIVFVIDTSGSMKWIVGQNREPYYSGEKSRLRITKNVAESFINKFNDGKNQANISILEYNNYASEITDDFININSNNINSLTGKYGYIESLRADGSTNIGDGLRKAYYELSSKVNDGKDKYIVLMTDGEAEAYSHDRSGSYYMGDGNYYGYYSHSNAYQYESTSWNNDWYGNRYADPDYRQKSMDYAKKVASELIANTNDNLNVNTFVIGFGNGTDGDKNKQITDAAKGTYFQAQDENTINAVYDKIQKIIDTNVSGKVHLEENISSNLEVVEVKNKDLPQDYKIDGNKLMIDVNNYYTLTNGNYSADPIEFTVKYKVKDNNLCKLGAGGNSSFVKLDVLGKTDTKYLVEKILGGSLPTQVTMEVSDTTGIIDKYDTSAQNPPSNRYDKVNSQYKLLGDSYINIATQGSDINFFQYQFVKSDSNPSTLPESGWKDLDIAKEEINEDVDVDNGGKLTQRSYDVSHLGTISDEAKWNNRQEVFKNPFEATTYKDASYSSTKEQYGGWQSYVKNDGSTGQRWVTKSVFMNKMNIGLNDPQNKDYKEASKFWGYIKVPTTGSYNFAGTSDDGCTADITVNGTTTRIVDMFKVQGSTFGSTNQTLQLEANKYYPIYIEYFNWGGEAEFRLQYKASNSSSWTNIPQSYFYPSKSTAPGEYATNRFSGRAGIKIPDEMGKYYIAYRTGKKDINNNIIEIQKSGFYGAFIRDERFVLSRSLTNNGADKIGDEFEINYTINPKEIPVTDVYKNYQDGNTNVANTLTISNLKIQQLLPDGLTYIGSSNNITIVNNSNQISGVINSNIVYILDKTDLKYKANSLTISIKVKPTVSGTFELLENNSILTYTDISIDATKQGAQRQMNFPVFSLNVNGESSVILKHGIYDETVDDYVNENNLNVVNTMPTKLAMLVDVKSTNPVINWSIDDIGKISNENSKIKFYQYEILDGSINTNNKIGPLEFNVGNIAISNNNGFNMEKGKKYIIVYTITPKDSAVGNITIGANVEGGNSKPITLNIEALPDLF